MYSISLLKKVSLANQRQVQVKERVIKQLPFHRANIARETDRTRLAALIGGCTTGICAMIDGETAKQRYVRQRRTTIVPKRREHEVVDIRRYRE